VYSEDHYSNINLLVERVNQDLHDITKWTAHPTKNLKLNANKCVAMILGTSKMVAKINPATVEPVIINDQAIPWVTSVKNLGIVFDQNLNWNNHTAYICSTVYGKL